MKIEATRSPVPESRGVGLQGDRDEFLRLFMAQLAHQDPFAPTSGADMVAQLAQLSSVEQAKQTNDRLAELAAQQASAASASLSSLVGRDAAAIADTFRIEQPRALPPLEVSSPSPIRGASIVITDASGRELRRLPIPTATSSQIAWDGKDAAGNLVGSGDYRITIDGGTSSAAITARWHGRVDAVELTHDGPRLRMGGLVLAPGDIRSIGSSENPTTPGAP